MTDKEIKLELAKAALKYGQSLQTCKEFYDWIAEEPEVEEKTEQKNSFDDIDIKEVLNIVRKNKFCSSGIATMLETVFHNSNISTVGDLTRIGRRDFSRFRLVGKKSIRAIDDALEELGVKGW